MVWKLVVASCELRVVDCKLFGCFAFAGTGNKCVKSTCCSPPTWYSLLLSIYLELTSILLLALEQKECGFSLVTYDLFVQDLCKKVDDQNRLNTVVVGVQQVRPPRLKIRKFLSSSVQSVSSTVITKNNHKVISSQ